MHRWIPEKPAYRKEQGTVGYLSLTAFLLLFLCRLLQEKWRLFGSGAVMLPILELAIFFIPVFLYILLLHRPDTRSLRLRLPQAFTVPFLFASFFLLFSGCLLLSMLFGGNNSLGNSIAVYEDAALGDILRRLFAILTLAIAPALAEELFFRGVLCPEYERRGIFRSVLMSALLFALIHFDLQNLPVYFFSGILFALVLYATDSLFATVFLHALYNIISLFGQRYLNALFDFTGSVSLFLFFLILIFLISLIFFCRTGAVIYRMRDENDIGTPWRAVPRDVQFYTTLDALKAPPVLLCFALSVAGFVFL